jgi:hypothetical protein
MESIELEHFLTMTADHLRHASHENRPIRITEGGRAVFFLTPARANRHKLPHVDIGERHGGFIAD